MLFSPILLFGFTLTFIASFSSALWYRLLWGVASGANKRRYKTRFLFSFCISISAIGAFKQGANIAFAHDVALLGFTLQQEGRYVLDGGVYILVPWDNTQVSFPNALRQARELVISEQRRAWEEYSCQVKNEINWSKENVQKPHLKSSDCAEDRD